MEYLIPCPRFFNLKQYISTNLNLVKQKVQKEGLYYIHVGNDLEPKALNLYRSKVRNFQVKNNIEHKIVKFYWNKEIS